MQQQFNYTKKARHVIWRMLNLNLDYFRQIKGKGISSEILLFLCFLSANWAGWDEIQQRTLKEWVNLENIIFLHHKTDTEKIKTSQPNLLSCIYYFIDKYLKMYLINVEVYQSNTIIGHLFTGIPNNPISGESTRTSSRAADVKKSKKSLWNNFHSMEC